MKPISPTSFWAPFKCHPLAVVGDGYPKSSTNQSLLGESRLHLLPFFLCHVRDTIIMVSCWANQGDGRPEHLQRFSVIQFPVNAKYRIH